MDWAFILRIGAYVFMFLAFEALAVHMIIRKRGDNWGRLILKVLLTGYATMLVGSAIVGSISYILLLGLK